MKTRKNLVIGSLIAGTLALGVTTYSQADNDSYADSAVSGNGDIRVPDNFRTDFTMLGSWSVAGDVDTGGEIGMHVVYASEGTVKAYRKTGKFPDGAVLVKELFNTKTEALTTGNATSVTDTAGYFVMVKDTKGRFPDNALWGDGWGWSFFAADSRTKTASTDYKADCLACHEPVRANDLVYDYAYPVLKK